MLNVSTLTDLIQSVCFFVVTIIFACQIISIKQDIAFMNGSKKSKEAKEREGSCVKMTPSEKADLDWLNSEN